MKNLLNFIVRFHNFIIFLFLETLAIYLLATNNNYHNTKVVKSINGITYGLEKRITNTRAYLRLNEINASLAVENAYLKNEIERLRKEENSVFFSFSDSLSKQQYNYTSAKIVNNSTNKQKNFITINKGRLNGIYPDMAVISPTGVAGIVVSSSNNYSVAMSLLNLDFRLSSRIRRNGYFGSLAWDGRNYQYAILNDIPNHIDIAVGDTIETTSFSAIFPQGLFVGTISDFEKASGDFYTITVRLATDFKNLEFVNIIGNLRKTEQQELENLTGND
jgi:rod shape-determining protein MreC